MTLVDPAEPFRRQNEKLLTIAEALIRRVEHGGHAAGDAYLQFERAALLEEEVRQRTAELERTLDLLHRSNARLSEAMTEAEAARANVTDAIEAVEEGFGLFDADDLLVLHNSRFCSALGGVAGALEPGLPFERFIGLVSESPDLSLLGGQTAGEWATRRMRRHGAGRTTFNVPLTDDRWLQVSEQRTETGGTVILQTDITDTIRSERRERDRIIDRQARMVKATLDHIAQGVAIFDRRARLMGWNEKMNALVGHPLPGEMLGTSFERVLDGIDAVFTYGAAVDRAAFEAWAAQGHKRRPLSFEVERIGGRSFTVLAQEMPDRGFVVSLTDVTAERATARALRDMAASLERRVESRTNALGEALEEARRANASKTRFMAAASHDLLQPLSAAKLFAGTLEERSDTEEQREIAGKVVSALASVETIIDALLNISKLDSGRVEYKIAPVPLATLLAGLRDEMAPLAATRGVELRVVPSSLAVESDIVLLRRVVQNLVANAIRHGEGSRVLIGVRRAPGGKARIEVWDEGPGIPKSEQAAIFEEFRQLAPRRSGANGIGLGLAIVDRACAMLGHGLFLESDEGRGSCFAVGLDVAAGAGVVPSRVAATRSEGPPGLIVALLENDPGMARAVTVMIEGWGSDVVQASSGEDMLALLAELDIVPDLFLVDHQLDGEMNGLGFAEAAGATMPRVPVVLISADRSDALSAACAGRGFAFLPKPFSREALARVLTSATREG